MEPVSKNENIRDNECTKTQSNKVSNHDDMNVKRRDEILENQAQSIPSPVQVQKLERSSGFPKEEMETAPHQSSKRSGSLASLTRMSHLAQKDLCHLVCHHCSSVMSRRWSSLCYPDCHEYHRGGSMGKSYEMCFAVWHANMGGSL